MTHLMYDLHLSKETVIMINATDDYLPNGVDTVSGSWLNGSPVVKADKVGVGSQTSQFQSERLPRKQFSKLVTLG